MRHISAVCRTVFGSLFAACRVVPSCLLAAYANRPAAARVFNAAVALIRLGTPYLACPSRSLMFGYLNV
jgi:hypothetical protein